MTVEKLEVLKVKLENEYYILIVPNKELDTGNKFRDFFLANELVEDTMWMFACEVESDDEAVRIAINNAEEYIDEYREGMFEDEII